MQNIESIATPLVVKEKCSENPEDEILSYPFHGWYCETILLDMLTTIYWLKYIIQPYCYEEKVFNYWVDGKKRMEMERVMDKKLQKIFE